MPSPMTSRNKVHRTVQLLWVQNLQIMLAFQKIRWNSFVCVYSSATRNTVVVLNNRNFDVVREICCGLRFNRVLEASSFGPVRTWFAKGLVNPSVYISVTVNIVVSGIVHCNLSCFILFYNAKACIPSFWNRGTSPKLRNRKQWHISWPCVKMTNIWTMWWDSAVVQTAHFRRMLRRVSEKERSHTYKRPGMIKIKAATF